MDTPDGGGGFPHIPEEWNRVNSKPTAKNVSTTPLSRVSLKGTTVNTAASGAVAGGATSAKKRKRPAAAASGAANATARTAMPASTTTEEIYPRSSLNPITPTADTAVSSPPVSRNCEETESVLRGLYHQVEKLARRPGCALEDGIYLDCIMTHIPYTDVLEQMFGGNEVTDSACVPVVTRAYEESYMREMTSASEQACIMGNNCECQFVDEHNPFIGVQFTLPVDVFSSSTATAGMVEELSSNRLCVLCCRKNTQLLFYEALYNHRAYSACIQLYGNICDRPGEYAKEAMLICPLSGPVHNMPLPVVAHQRNRYTVVVHNGIRQLRQHRVGYEDFHAPSSSRC
jgi:hypothetical protein